MNLLLGDIRIQTPASRGEPKLLDQVRDLIRLKHYSIRTEQAYPGWSRRFIRFHHQRHPKEMGKTEIEAFLIHLAIQENVAVRAGVVDRQYP